MSILEKLNIEELSDTKLRDEILRTEEQIKILELTEKEYNGYLQLLKAEREKREIKEPDYLHRHMRAIRIIDEFTYIFFEIDGTLYYDCFLQRKKNLRHQWSRSTMPYLLCLLLFQVKGPVNR